MLRCLSLALVLAAPASAETLGLGRPALPEEIAAWDIDVRPDGAGLPEGSGDVLTGEEIYLDLCSTCHGAFGEGAGRWPVLMGGFGTLDGTRPVKTVGSYWPYLSTVWDYVHRAMPFGDAQSLTADEVYALTAYLLYLNDLVPDDFVLDRANLAETPLPNEDGFFLDDREEVELPLFSGEACMTDCKENVGITMRAAVLDVTPEDQEAREARGEAAAAADQGNPNLAAAARDIEPSDAEGSLTMVGADPELVALGEALFRQCRACHEVGEGADNRVGPHLNGVIGRVAGGVDDYRYSSAMANAGEAGLVWDAVSLHDFLADPRGYMTGTKMAFRGMQSEEDIDAMIAYLGSIDG
ncbi:c-type cytochrome [Roseitranquillus sediminis]|uniref:c-type cytochrome n=1 Tax=Roseitranquillus sediminis TaxID=2809051 RepID=UPI001D0C5A7B|nr:c-type cytochrome [Roseitranquillus sediminis]MBM9594885.1 c-type cytochrome [Roseitranquillus sediminis]